MAKSKKATQKKETKQVEQKTKSVDAPQQQAKRKPVSSIRRVPVQYTPRIPTARCPWC